MNGSWPLNDLVSYLWGSGWLASIQFALFVALFCGAADRTARAWGWYGPAFEPDEKIASPMLEQLTYACMGMGLLLTFSGLYTFVGLEQQDDRQPLLLALGSSALGYGGWTLIAVAGMADHVRPSKVATSPPDDGRPASRKSSIQASLTNYQNEEWRDESQYVGDLGGGRGHLGGAVSDAVVAGAVELGGPSGDGVDQFFAPLADDGRRAATGVAEARSDGDLAGSGPRPDHAAGGSAHGRSRAEKRGPGELEIVVRPGARDSGLESGRGEAESACERNPHRTPSLRRR